MTPRTDVIQNTQSKTSILYDALTKNKLELILFPTEQCNFRCTYCYEDFKIKRMPKYVVSGIKSLILKRAPELNILHLSWFGGEPLVAYDIVKEISKYAQDVANSHNFTVVGSMTTNGFNLDETRIIELDRLNIPKIQISLDGNKDAHDMTRLRANGDGTFETIWRNILVFNNLYNSGKIVNSKIILRIHLHPRNIDSVYKLSGDIRKYLNPECFSVHMKSIGHYGGENDKNFSVFHDNSELLTNHQSELYNYLSDFHQEFSNEDVYVCYAAKANSFIIRGDGRIGKCTVALNNKENSIGRILENGKLDLDAEKFGAWLYPLSSLNRSDLGCPISGLYRNMKGDIAR